MGKNKQPAPADIGMRGLKKSTAVKRAAAYKKRIGTGKIKYSSHMAISICCVFAALLFAFVFLQNKHSVKEKAPSDSPSINSQENPLIKESSASMALGSSPAMPQGEATPYTEAKDPYADAIDEMESGVSRILDSDVPANISADLFSEDIQPRAESDFLPVLQQRLMDLYYMEHDEPTTYYGVTTEEAIREFQAQHALPETGVASYQVLLLLFSKDATSKRFTLGQEGQSIALLQERLAQLGYTVPTTGKFGEKTAQAVREIQKRNNLPQTGVIDNVLQELLFSEGVIGSDGKPYLYTAPEQTLNINALLETAYAQLGVKYVRGGKSAGGFDCSGLVYYCLRKSGYKLSYMTSAGWRSTSLQYIKRMEDLQPGDICTFNGHVGIYVGYGKMIDASSTEGRVRITGDIKDSSYWRENWKGGRRINATAE